MAPTATTVLNVARSTIGTVERPLGSNRTPFGAWYGWDGVFWCDIWVSWVAARAGATNIIGRSAWTPGHAQWFKSRGQWHTWRETPRRGDIVFLDLTGNHRDGAPSRDGAPGIAHVGILESFDAQRQVMVTLEGNTSSGAAGSQRNGVGVYRRRRSTLYLAGFGRPAYGGEKSVRPLPRPTRGTPRRTPPLLVDGVWGAATTKALQRWAGVPADGVIGPNTRKAVQRRLRVKQDGDWGPATTRAWRKRLGIPTTGGLDRTFTRALQRHLNRVT